MTGLADRWRSWPRGRRRSFVMVVAVGAGLAAVLGHAGTDGLIYYRTPTEVLYADTVSATDETVRVGGLVVAGSVRESTERSSLVLTDGTSDVEVHYLGRFPDVVQEGQGAVVEGRWQPDGVLLGEEVVMRHSNEYQAAEQAT